MKKKPASKWGGRYEQNRPKFREALKRQIEAKLRQHKK